MTLIIAAIGHIELFVAADTMGTDLESGEPSGRSAKLWTPESGKYIIAGSGLGNLIEAWMAEVVGVDPQDFEALVRFSSEALPDLARRIRDQLGSDLPKTTAQCLGFAHDGTPTRIQFSSEINFDPKVTTAPGVYVKPNPPGLTDRLANTNVFTNSGLIKFAKTAEMLNRQNGSPVNIGGQLLIARIDRRGRVAHKAIHRFKDRRGAVGGRP